MSPLIQATTLHQLQRERTMLSDGHDRFLERQAKLKDLSVSKSHSKLLQNAISAVKANIDNRLLVATTNIDHRPMDWVKDISTVDSELLAYAGLVCSMEAVGLDATRTKCLRHIGGRIEMEHFAAGLYQHDKKLAARITELAIRNNSSSEHRKKAVRAIAAKEGYAPEKWSQERCMKAAAPVFSAVIEASGIFEVWTQTKKEKTIYRMGLTEAASEDIADLNNVLSWNEPVFTPMVTEPAGWEELESGCYLDPSLAHMTPLIRRASPKQMRMARAAIRSGRMQPAIDAINAVQRTKWHINEYTLAAVEWCWENNLKPSDSFPRKDYLPAHKFPDGYDDLDDKQKKGHRIKAANIRRLNRQVDGNRSIMSTDIKQARSLLEYSHFYMPHSFDFRGRIYPVCNFNTQRSDHIKSMFKFATGKPLGARGVHWLAIHLANCGDFDKISKCSFDNRVDWVAQNADRLAEIGNDFEGTYAGDDDQLYWSDADKPFAFLAACREFFGFWIHGEDYVSSLPVNLDGSNSGIQHFSAASRTATDGALVNLMPADKPQDIYQAVADKVVEAMQADDADEVKEWLAHGITRKTVKRNVMTYGYSSEKYGFSDQIIEDHMNQLEADVIAGKLNEHPFKEPARAARTLANYNWDAINSVIRGAAAGMNFYQEMARVMANYNMTMSWFTPVGFPVDNAYYKTKSKRLRIYLYDKEAATGQSRTAVTMNKDDYKVVDVRKCVSAISPNVIHSLDSSHLLSTVLLGLQHNIKDWCLIHDSFGTLPSDTDKLFHVVRQSFVEQYEDKCIYSDIRKQLIDLLMREGHNVNEISIPSIPTKGTLDIKHVLESDYCFA